MASRMLSVPPEETEPQISAGVDEAIAVASDGQTLLVAGDTDGTLATDGDPSLFIMALVIPSVLVFRHSAGWEPSASFGSSLWRVLKIVTMFTLAHTITLTLGGLGIVEFPPALVETTIAISIILAALLWRCRSSPSAWM